MQEHRREESKAICKSIVTTTRAVPVDNGDWGAFSWGMGVSVVVGTGKNTMELATSPPFSINATSASFRVLLGKVRNEISLSTDKGAVKNSEAQHMRHSAWPASWHLAGI